MNPFRLMVACAALACGSWAWGAYDLGPVDPQAKGAFDDGDYAKMAEVYEKFCADPDATFEDRIWLGNARQLNGEWKKAAEAYRAAAKAWTPEPDDDRKPWGRGYKLGLLIERIELRELHDPAAAVKTINDTLARMKEPGVPKGWNFNPATHEWAGLRLDLLEDLVDAQENLGDLKAALATLVRLDELQRGSPDPDRVARMLDRLPPDPPAEFPTLISLTSAKPGVTLMLDEEATRRRAYEPPRSPGPFWQYGFVPPQGKEFASFDFRIDCEEIDPRFGGQLECFVITSDVPPVREVLGRIFWPHGKPAGREFLESTIDVPPGARLVRIMTGSGKNAFNVRSVEATATFRDAAKGPLLAKAITRTATVSAARAQPGGTLMVGDMTLGDRSIDVKPGRYHVRYEVPGRADTFETDLALDAGERAWFYVNLDSPFRWTQAPLAAGIGYSPDRSGLAKYIRTTLAPLPDGSWLSAFRAPVDKTGVSLSKDLLAWEPARILPCSSIFECLEPSLLRASDGTVWLLYLSDRLSFPNWSSAGWTLWLTSTRDGRTWSPLKPVSVPGIGDMFVGPQMLQRRDGTCWIFWRDCAGSGKSFADIHELRAIDIAQPAEKRVGINAFGVAEDDAGLLHMVFTCDGQEVWHATSRDGFKWDGTKEVLRPGDIDHPSILCANGRAALFFSTRGGVFAVPLHLDGRASDMSEAVMIARGGVESSPPMLTKEGDVLLVVGKDKPWLLRAKAEAVMDARPGGKK